MAHRHPYFHNFAGQRVNDEVIISNARGVPLVIKRHQWCKDCSIERTHFIDVPMWKKSGYNYKNRPKDLERVTREEFTRDEFLATTDLPETIIKRLRKAPR